MSERGGGPRRHVHTHPAHRPRHCTHTYTCCVALWLAQQPITAGRALPRPTPARLSPRTDTKSQVPGPDRSPTHPTARAHHLSGGARQSHSSQVWPGASGNDEVRTRGVRVCVARHLRVPGRQTQILLLLVLWLFVSMFAFVLLFLFLPLLFSISMLLPRLHVSAFPCFTRARCERRHGVKYSRQDNCGRPEA